MPKTRKSWNKHLLGAPRDEISLWVQFITGHNYLNYHRYNTGQVESPLCRKCGKDNETSWHLFKMCDAMAHDRIILMMNTEDITELPEPDERLLLFVQSSIFPLLKIPEA